MTLPSGTRLGPYEILAPIGAGGMGEVYRAKDAKLGREIAVKVLPELVAADADRRRRFEQEARSASALNHPNILTIYDIGQSNGTVYIAMELVEGKTLRELVAAGEPVPTKKLLDVAVQTAEGLAKAHAAGIVHRDLKPENLMVSRDGFVKILDFGLAKLTETTKQDESVAPTAIAAPTQPGTVMGTAGYMSPEQASGQVVDYHSDQFTLGAILYEMATGKRAFQRKTGAETLVAIIKEEPEPLSQLAPRAPAPVRWIVERLLAKDPEERYASTKDLARDLKSLRDHLSETSASGGLETVEPARVRRRGWLVPALLALLVGIGLGFLARTVFAARPSAPIQFRRLTYQRGRIVSARFAPDGQTIVYSASWQGRPVELFSTRADVAESRSLGMPGAAVLSISSTGELAVSLGRRGIIGYETTGTLARVPLAGGAPREILESVQDADWSPDGQSLAVCRVVGSRSRLEYPVGKVLYETPGWVSGVRISPDGQLLAFAEHVQRGNNDGYLKIVDTAGKLRLAGPYAPGFAGLAWSPKGDEVWWGGIQATSIEGKTRTVWPSPNANIQDIARDGSVLLGDGTARREIVGYAAIGAPPRNLTELNWSFPTDISDDGKRVLFTEQQRPPPSVYVRGLDGSPAVRIAEGEGYAFSPDGRWALTVRIPERRKVVLVPTGAGEPKTLDLGEVTCGWANWFPDGKQLLLAASEPGRGVRLFVLDVAGGKPRAITPEGVVIAGQSVSPDGRSIIARGPDGRFAIYSTEPGEPRPIPWLEPEEVPLHWTADGRSLYVSSFSEPPGIIDVVDIATGKRSRFTEFEPPDPTGIEVVGPAVIAPDGKSYVYSYRRALDDLYLATGMR
jgi:serine/threonine protein kinase/Tol biopolymer transport system component